MTKVSVFGQETEKKKPIEFVKILAYDGTICDATDIKPSRYDHVQLLEKEAYIGTLSLIMAWDNKGTNQMPTIYLGHWNDGFVE